MSEKYFTRMGDGEGVWMTKDEIRNDVNAGMEDAVFKGKSQPLDEAEIEQLVDILTMPAKNVSVERGNEGIVTFDAGTLKLPVRAGIPVDRSTTLLIHERILCSDTMELCNTDYSYKAIKNIAPEEGMAMEQAQMNCIMPIFYGAMPNMGLYTKPDGPVENWAMLLPEGKIKEAIAAQEEAAELCKNDMIYIGSVMAESGACGLQFDTCGASGDADAYAALGAAKVLSGKYPDCSITMGMANEFHLGMHGKLKFEDQRLAGQYPAKQVKSVEAAGAKSYGCVVNTNSSKSFAWNLSRSVTYVKEATRVSNIPVLVDVGMGVGGIPLTNTSPTDATTRVSKAMLEVGKADGL
jgi:dimethylamine--corrinoid protein Co-methyltransferase